MLYLEHGIHVYLQGELDLLLQFFSSFSKSNYLKHYKFSTEGIVIFLSATLKSSRPITAPFASLLKLISAFKELACYTAAWTNK